ncbi:cyclic nucleotide-binding domain-containing protein [Limnoglobus roseus]|uniref:4Fe-4S dicluster domain-containing protein n=1 Tax=Limnoglobus roseus TaxID=2598579 RepID=A0A5C1AFF9_9BACT|nr:cyclic nucleotide-binding domain-containing protein [Limnoglobus roseus]QEL16953.1 4Fe-4S dicluster domain-containing protein [Limnoglobus roseus]
MAISLDLWDSFGGGRDSETVFARDEDGNLIRRVQATRKDLDEKIDIVIDGFVVKDMPLATMVKDAQGTPQFDLDGYPKLRKTTIYDAAMELVRREEWSQDELERRIPVLCHREHLHPVAVCRMCSVHVIRKKRGAGGKLMPNDKLVPACQFEIQPGMVVTTRCGPNPPNTEKTGRDFTAEVLQSISVITEYLVGDHYKPDDSRRKIFSNELKAVADHLNVEGPRPGLPARISDGRPGRNAQRHSKSRPSIPLPVVADGYKSLSELPETGVNPEFPYSSRTVAVDHDRCIVCDRCVRSCHDVRPFKVIGHTGKGYLTRISFDLDENMNDSSCVQCGECMNSCPTGALQLNRRIIPIGLREQLGLTGKSADDEPLLAELESPRTPINSKAVFESPSTGKSATGFLSAEEMQALKFQYIPKESPNPEWFQPFRDVPLSYLRWNEGAVQYRKLKQGDEICTQGHYSNSAFFIKSGEFGIWKRSGPARRGANGTDAGEKSPFGLKSIHTIIGELAPLSNQPRVATVRVTSDEAEVYEITRNILDVAQRVESARDVLGLIYTRNALFASLDRKSDNPNEPSLFEGLSGKERADVVKLLTEGVRDESKKLPDPGARKPTDEEGRKIVYPVIDPDANLVRATLRRCQRDEKIVIEGEKAQDFYIIRYGTVKVSIEVEDREVIVAKQSENEYFGEVALMQDGRRTATITALDTVELVRIPKLLFMEMIKRFPSMKERFEKAAAARLARGQQAKPVVNNYLSDYLNQGLYQGRNLLVLDLHSCTRCDECTRACADSHGDGYSRLLREGMRFGKFLVAASCRSCYKPYCMDGCPVDAIHRSGTELHIKIDDHCIRCGQCERNCPYGAIQIPDKMEVSQKISIADTAVNCDKCHDLVPEGADPFCVAACPHEAAFRMTGPDLYKKVTKQTI